MNIHNPIIKEETGPPGQSPISAPKLDLNKYRAMIKDERVTQEQADEILKCFWEIAATFARLGHGLDPVQVVFSERLLAAWQAAQESEDTDDNA